MPMTIVDDLAPLPGAADTYLTQADFCRRYRVAPRTAERWRITGDGPPWVRVGQRRIVYRLSDCQAWAAERTFAHRADELAHSETEKV
jgi:hypothetical protein